MITVKDPLEAIFSEKYRPRTIDECILPQRFKDPLNEILKTGEIPHLILSGPAGCSKCLDPNEEIEILVSDEIYEKLMKNRNAVLV